MPIALQPDGKILIGGAFIAVSGYVIAYVARLNTDGTLDPDLQRVRGQLCLQHRGATRMAKY